MSINYDLGYLFLLVLMRMTGVFVIHPILGRSNVPSIARVGLSLGLTLAVYRTAPSPGLTDPTLLQLAPLIFKELIVGIVCAFLTHMFLSVLIVAGEMVDMQMGLGMAKAFDPGTNASISLSAQLFNILFVLGFFATNNHLTLIQMVAMSLRILPPGNFTLNMEAFYLIPQLLTSILLFAVKLCMPIVVIEIITTFAVGIIMRIIPQINVFVLNIQLKLGLGLIVLFLLMPTFSAFIENLLLISTEHIWTVWENLGA